MTVQPDHLPSSVCELAEATSSLGLAATCTDSSSSKRRPRHRHRIVKSGAFTDGQTMNGQASSAAVTTSISEAAAANSDSAPLSTSCSTALAKRNGSGSAHDRHRQSRLGQRHNRHHGREKINSVVDVEEERAMNTQCTVCCTPSASQDFSTAKASASSKLSSIAQTHSNSMRYTAKAPDVASSNHTNMSANESGHSETRAPEAAPQHQQRPPQTIDPPSTKSSIPTERGDKDGKSGVVISQQGELHRDKTTRVHTRGDGTHKRSRTRHGAGEKSNDAAAHVVASGTKQASTAISGSTSNVEATATTSRASIRPTSMHHGRNSKSNASHDVGSKSRNLAHSGNTAHHQQGGSDGDAQHDSSVLAASRSLTERARAVEPNAIRRAPSPRRATYPLGVFPSYPNAAGSVVSKSPLRSHRIAAHAIATQARRGQSEANASPRVAENNDDTMSASSSLSLPQKQSLHAHKPLSRPQRQRMSHNSNRASTTSEGGVNGVQTSTSTRTTVTTAPTSRRAAIQTAKKMNTAESTSLSLSELELSRRGLRVDAAEFHPGAGVGDGNANHTTIHHHNSRHTLPRSSAMATPTTTTTPTAIAISSSSLLLSSNHDSPTRCLAASLVVTPPALRRPSCTMSNLFVHDVDNVRHNRIAMSDLVAKDEMLLLDLLVTHPEYDDGADEEQDDEKHAVQDEEEGDDERTNKTATDSKNNWVRDGTCDGRGVGNDASHRRTGSSIFGTSNDNSSNTHASNRRNKIAEKGAGSRVESPVHDDHLTEPTHMPHRSVSSYCCNNSNSSDDEEEDVSLGWNVVGGIARRTPVSIGKARHVVPGGGYWCDDIPHAHHYHHHGGGAVTPNASHHTRGVSSPLTPSHLVHPRHGVSATPSCLAETLYIPLMPTRKPGGYASSNTSLTARGGPAATAVQWSMASYDDMATDLDQWEVNSSAYADSLDEAQVQWIEEQLQVNENPEDFFP